MQNIVARYEYLITKINMRLEKQGSCLLCVIFYKLLLDFLYCFYISNYYSTCYLIISPLGIVNGWILVLLMSRFIFIFYKQQTCSAVIMVALNIIYFIPITTYCGYGGGSSLFLFYAGIYWAFFSFLQYKVPFIVCEVRKLNTSRAAFYVMLIGVSVITLYFWIEYTNFRIMFNLMDVYDVRAEAATYDIPQVLQYARALSNIVMSVLIVLALKNRKYIALIWLLFLTLLAFSFAGDKSVILFPVILIGGYVFYRKDMLTLMLPVGIVFQLIAIVEAIIGSKYIITLVFHRMIMVPAALSDWYYRFYNEHTVDLYRNGVMGKFGFDSVYKQIIPNVIGNNIESQTINCNNGLLADVWANIGIIGIIIMPIILIVCFRLLDFVTYGIDFRMTIGIILFFAICFSNASWSTVLLTKGYLAICLFFLFFPREDMNIAGGNSLHENYKNLI